MDWNRELQIRYTPDVLVIGGGPAGCAAAYAAARGGASVLLVEGAAFLGGMGTAALVPLFLGFSDGEHFLAGNFGRELLCRMHTAGRHSYRQRPDAEVIHPEALKRAYEELLLEAGVQVLLTTRMVDVCSSGGKIEACILSGKSGVYAARARQYIDCTGDGDLCVRAGAQYAKGDEDGLLMGGTLCSQWTGAQWHRTSGEAHNSHIDQAVAEGVLSVADYHLPGLMQQSGLITNGNTGHCFGLDGTDDESLTQAMSLGRRQLKEYEQYYRRYLPGFEHLELLTSGAQMGVRETRIIRGRERLTLEDFLSRRKFPNEIARFAYCVDIHAGNSSREKYDLYYDEFHRYRYQPGESYGVPYGVILPEGLKNCYVAGRCVSTDRYMQSSLRVMPGCMLTGMAAGFAAAHGARHGLETGDVPYRAVRARLEGENVYLGEE